MKDLLPLVFTFFRNNLAYGSCCQELVTSGSGNDLFFSFHANFLSSVARGYDERRLPTRQTRTFESGEELLH